jgi:hypothetical protein
MKAARAIDSMLNKKGGQLKCAKTAASNTGKIGDGSPNAKVALKTKTATNRKM